MIENVVVKVNPDRKFELPPEITDQLRVGDEYKVLMTEGEIVLRKIEKPLVDLDDFFNSLEQMEPDPNQLSLQEISDVVKEMRRERWSNQ